jgi:hypothetical protein
VEVEVKAERRAGEAGPKFEVEVHVRSPHRISSAIASTAFQRIVVCIADDRGVVVGAAMRRPRTVGTVSSLSRIWTFSKRPAAMASTISMSRLTKSGDDRRSSIMSGCGRSSDSRPPRTAGTRS